MPRPTSLSLFDDARRSHGPTAAPVFPSRPAAPLRREVPSRPVREPFAPSERTPEVRALRPDPATGRTPLDELAPLRTVALPLLREPHGAEADPGASTGAPGGHDLLRGAAAPGGSGLTLDDVLLGAWEGLTVERRAVTCLVCDGEMQPRWGATSVPVGGRCTTCQTTLV